MSSGQSTSQPSPTHRDAREVEWQLAATDLGPVRRWLDEIGTIDGLVLEPRSTLQIRDTYFDTPDWRIHRAGFALRIRSEDGRSEATLKSLHSNSTEMADRRELSESLDGTETEAIAESNGPVGARVQAVSGAQPLKALFEVHTSRQRYCVHAADDKQPLGEIALDDTVISRPHGQPETSLQRVEVEALTDAHEPLQTLVEALRSECSLESAAVSKYAEGLKTVGLAPQPSAQLSPTYVDASMRIDEIALANLRLYLSAWNRHEPGARLGDDPEELHDLRVAGRRIDAMLRQFSDYLPAGLVQMRATLKEVLRVLGETRDLDVALVELASYRRKLGEADRSSLEPLERHLRAELLRARTKMLEVLDRPAVQKEFEKFAQALAAPATELVGSPAAPTLPGVEAMRELIRRRYKKVRKGADRLKSHSPMDAYHAVRSEVKKLRYALESAESVLGKPGAEMLNALRRWQDRLGVQQDAHVASERLQELASAPPGALPSETLFLMGRLAAHYADRALKARKRHPRAYRKVRERWKALKCRLQELAPAQPAPGV